MYTHGRTMYVHCMYGLGSNLVPKRNIRITFGLGSDRFSPIAIQNKCAYGFGSHLDVRVCTYNVCRVSTYNVRTYLYLYCT